MSYYVADLHPAYGVAIPFSRLFDRIEDAKKERDMFDRAYGGILHLIVCKAPDREDYDESGRLLERDDFAEFFNQ